MKFSAAQAAKQVGRSTATITRAIEKRKLSAEKDGNGAWQIEASELYRVFAPAKPENPTMQRTEKANETGGLQADLDLMAEKLRSAEALNDRLADEVSDLRRRLDDEASERRKITALLMPPVVAPAPQSPAAGQGKPVGGFFSRLLGKGAANE